jgi:hypothetical protein
VAPAHRNSCQLCDVTHSTPHTSGAWCSGHSEEQAAHAATNQEADMNFSNTLRLGISALVLAASLISVSANAA